MRVQGTLLAALLVLSASCASSPGTSTPAASTPAASAPAPSSGAQSATAAKVAKRPYVISQAELQDPAITSRDAYTAIRMLRPGFFTYRGPTSGSSASSGEVMVSQDFGPLQLAGMLKQMNTFGLTEVRYLNPEEAQLRFGLNANGGPVIVLLSSKQ